MDKGDGEAERTANPAQTIAYSWGKKGFRRNSDESVEISSNLRALSTLQYVVSLAD